MILEIALPIPIPKTFDYLLPSEEVSAASLIGSRVKVSFGPRQLTGVIVGTKEHSSTPIDRLKKITSIVDKEPIFDETSLKLAKWLAHRTVCSLGEAVFALLPPGEAAEQHSVDHHEDGYWHTEQQLNYQESDFSLTQDQKSAIEKIHGAIYKNTPHPNPLPQGERELTFLLKGVAAAGKTEVYIAAIKEIIQQGKLALYLAPEIGLVFQFGELLRGRFGEKNVYVWHSGVSLKERRENWWRIKNGEFSIVVGARSAALLPMPNLGLIVVDEEHDTAWKEDQKPRFHVRDLSRKRAELSKAIAIFGTATPSLELYHDVHSGHVSMLELNERVVKASAPVIRLIDRKSEKGKGVLSRSLEKAIGERLQKNEQTILFLNRRGFHRYLRCPSCEWTATCEKCGVTLVEHKTRSLKSQTLDSNKLIRVSNLRLETSSLVCHYCQSHYPTPTSCPKCGHKKIYSGGTGTERVMEEIQEKFPWARSARWDRDSVKKKGEQEKIFKDFRNGDIDILVGTQLVAQGFNFPKVTLVGVVDADVPLHIPNFRAAEHTFQLVMQVAGRAGRDMVTGEVLVQTRQPEHEALSFASQMNYSAFAKQELGFREALNYPPFAHLIEIQTNAKDALKVEKDMNTLVSWVESLKLDRSIGILGPSKTKRTRKSMKQLQLFLKVSNEIFDRFLDVLNDFYRENQSRYWINIDP